MMRRIILSLAGLACGVTVACSGSGTKVDVDLSEWAVKPAVLEVKPGKITFVTHNRSTNMIHELAILRVEGTNKKNVEEIEDIDPGKTKQATVDLKPGTYELACVIVPGEAGSTVDHYQQGMHVNFVVR